MGMTDLGQYGGFVKMSGEYGVPLLVLHKIPNRLAGTIPSRVSKSALPARSTIGSTEFSIISALRVSSSLRDMKM